MLVPFNGCINDNESNNGDNFLLASDATWDDLELSIEYKNGVYINFSNEIKINVKLKNKSNETVKIDKIFSLAYNLRILISLPTNESKELFIEHGDYNKIEKVYIEPDEFQEIILNLNDKYLKYYYMNESQNNIEEFKFINYGTGKYGIQIKYISTQPEIYSNIIEFEIN